MIFLIFCWSLKKGNWLFRSGGLGAGLMVLIQWWGSLSKSLNQESLLSILPTLMFLKKTYGNATVVETQRENEEILYSIGSVMFWLWNMICDSDYQINKINIALYVWFLSFWLLVCAFSPEKKTITSETIL